MASIARISFSPGIAPQLKTTSRYVMGLNLRYDVGIARPIPPAVTNIEHSQSKQISRQFAILYMKTSNSTSTTALERDPVCGMNVNPSSAKHVYEHAGKKYYFCCPSCVEKFKADPGKYLNKLVPSSSNLVMLGMPAAAKPSPHPETAHIITLQLAP